MQTGNWNFKIKSMKKQCKKHIVIVTFGGIGTGVSQLKEGIPILVSFVERLAKNYQITVLSLNPINQEFKPLNYQVVSPLKEVGLPLKLVWLIRNFRRCNRKQKVDLIHSMWGFPQGFFSVLLKYLYKIPVFIHLQGGDSTYIPEINYGVFGSFWKKKILSWAYQKADELIVLTAYQKKQLSLWFDRKTLNIIPFGLNKEQYLPVIKPISYPVKFIHVGHLNKVKDQITLLKAFKLIRDKIDCTLRIVGGDTLNGQTQKFSDKLNLQNSVTFSGVKSHEETTKYIQESHVLLHTSLYEAQALAVNESLACGTAVLGTNVGLISDLNEFCTIASPIKDELILAKNVFKILGDSSYYESLIEKGIQWSGKNDLEISVHKFEGLYNRYFFD